MQISRRNFTGMSVLGIASAWMSTVAVSCGTVYASIVAYVGVGIQAFQAVVNLLAGEGIISMPEGTLITAILTMVKAGWADVQAAVSAYQNAPDAQKATLAGKVSTALTAVQTVINQFWQDVKIPDLKLSSTVAGLLGLIVSTIAGFLGALPPVPTPAIRYNATKAHLTVVAKIITVKQFRTEFNSILTSNGYGQHVI